MKITGISGQLLTFDPPLYHAYAAAQTPQVWELTGVTQQAGVEDLSLERVSPTGTEGYHNFKIVACAQCWLKNIVSVKTETFHVELDRTFQCEIRDSFFDNAWAFTGGLAYGVALDGRTSAALIENNIFYHARHAMIVKDGAAGNVFGYNYSVASYQGEDWLATDMNSHGAGTTMNLWEGNIGANELSREQAPCRVPVGNMASPKKCWISGVSLISWAVDETVVPVFLVAARFGTASATRR